MESTQALHVRNATIKPTTRKLYMQISPTIKLTAYTLCAGYMRVLLHVSIVTFTHALRAYRNNQVGYAQAVRANCAAFTRKPCMHIARHSS
jgi:hypothetical protein